MIQRTSGRLWRHSDFVLFWGGETISQFGNQVTLLALPLTAVLTLDASAAQMGVLNAASYLPFLVLTLFVGVWIDRVRRRPVMLFSALARTAVLAAIPLLAALDLLSMSPLYFAALLLGAGTVLFEVTYQAYLPSLVERDDLIEANSKLQVSTSSAQVAGPALGGVLVQWLTAPVALLVDAASFLVSALSIAAVRKPEPASAPAVDERRIWRDIGAGLRFTLGHRSLRACVLEAGTYNLFWLVLETVFLLYATRRLGMSASSIGLVFGAGAVGALFGAMAAGRVSARLGVGTTVTGAMIIGCAAPILVPLASGPPGVRLALLALSFFVGGAGTTVANIQVVSLRQVLTPNAMLGRMNASYRFVSWGVVPLGALLGGALGTAIGLRSTLFVGAAGIFAAALWIVFSPVRGIQRMPDEPEPGPSPAQSVAAPPGPEPAPAIGEPVTTPTVDVLGVGRPDGSGKG